MTQLEPTPSALTNLSLAPPAGDGERFALRARAREAAPEAAGPSDQEVVRRTLEGRREAFETLVRRYERPIYAHLLRMTGRPEDAEDLTQETFLNALRGLAGYRPERPFRAWLYRIATNAAISALRRRGPALISLDGDGNGEQPIEVADPGVITPVERLEREAMLEQLRQAVEALPAEGAALINLRYREGMSCEEIGAALGRKPGAIAVAIHRLRQRLRELVFGPDGA